MHTLEEQQKVVPMLKNVYDSIQFHGVYAKYTRSVGILTRILKLEDPAELHYIMMNLSRLSYLKNRSGVHVWASRRYAELLGCENFSALADHTGTDFLESLAHHELSKMEVEAFRFRQISTNLIDTHLKGKGQFTCHAKVYPVYGESGEVVLSLGILAEVAERENIGMLPRQQAVLDESVLAI